MRISAFDLKEINIQKSILFDKLTSPYQEIFVTDTDHDCHVHINLRKNQKVVKT